MLLQLSRVRILTPKISVIKNTTGNTFQKLPVSLLQAFKKGSGSNLPFFVTTSFFVLQCFPSQQVQLLEEGCSPASKALCYPNSCSYGPDSCVGLQPFLSTAPERQQTQWPLLASAQLTSKSKPCDGAWLTALHNRQCSIGTSASEATQMLKQLSILKSLARVSSAGISHHLHFM